jgi:hypothetical protein
MFSSPSTESTDKSHSANLPPARGIFLRAEKSPMTKSGNVNNFPKKLLDRLSCGVRQTHQFIGRLFGVCRKCDEHED